jgi:hypothetical protein
MSRVTFSIPADRLAVVERQAELAGESLSAYVAKAAYAHARADALTRWFASDAAARLDSDPAWQAIEDQSLLGDDEARRPGAAA